MSNLECGMRNAELLEAPDNSEFRIPHSELKIAITGNIGSGKSYVCGLFKALGIPVFDSDREAKLLYDRPEVKQKMIDRFGDSIYLPNGTLDRKLMASKVFSDPCALGYQTVLWSGHAGFVSRCLLHVPAQDTTGGGYVFLQEPWRHQNGLSGSWRQPS